MPKSAVQILMPLYNEEEVFSSLVARLSDLMKALDFSCEVLLVDDGSTDNPPS